jgi:hypothetical protein
MLGRTFFFRVFRVFRGRVVPVVGGGFVRGWDGDRRSPLRAVGRGGFHATAQRTRRGRGREVSRNGVSAELKFP